MIPQTVVVRKSNLFKLDVRFGLSCGGNLRADFTAASRLERHVIYLRALDLPWTQRESCFRNPYCVCCADHSVRLGSTNYIKCHLETIFRMLNVDAIYFWRCFIKNLNGLRLPTMSSVMILDWQNSLRMHFYVEPTSTSNFSQTSKKYISNTGMLDMISCQLFPVVCGCRAFYDSMTKTCISSIQYPTGSL